MRLTFGFSDARKDSQVTELKALIVEDDAPIATMIKAVLGQIGITKVTISGDGKQAVKMVQVAATPYDLVICDWSMPNMDGMEFLEWFRERHPKTPFVMLTAKTGALEFNQAKRKGADYFLMKPLLPEDLLLRLKGIVDTLKG